MNPNKNYDIQYFTKRRNLSLSSAENILHHLKNICDFLTVVDFGCGTGTWLKVCQQIGCTEIRGFDEFAKEDLLEISLDNFCRKNLGEKISLPKKYDLAISLEAAEHLSIDFADNIVENLVNASDVVLFSAAIPGQGGTNHLNEQPPSFWSDKFKQHSYIQLDPLRPLIWNDIAVAWWYKQNIFLYLNENSTSKIDISQLSKDLCFKHIVHPECLKSRIEELDIDNASIQNLFKAIIRKITQKFSF